MKNLMFCMLLILFSFPAIVDANEPVVGITMNKLSTSIHVGGTDQLQAIFAPDVIWHFTWNSSNPAVASVNAQHPEMGNAYGLVTGISPGTATITATRIDGVGYATCVVTVYDGNNSRGGCNALNYGIIGFSLIFTILLNARKNKSN